MKFGKYLASRQLELPEYSGHFIDYKALKKLIKHLGQPAGADGFSLEETQRKLQDNKALFFFKVERELDKVNSFYLEKQANLAVNLDVLVVKKNELLAKSAEQARQAADPLRLNFKDLILFLNLYQSFNKLHQDLLRLQQFIELNESGFLKVVKKWDKRSKSHTKELFIQTAVNVQPVFHRNEINDLSDLVSASLFTLESIMDGDYLVLTDSTIDGHGSRPSLGGYGSSAKIDTSKQAPQFAEHAPDELRPQGFNGHASTSNDANTTSIGFEWYGSSQIDELYNSFVNVAATPNLDMPVLERWLEKAKSVSGDAADTRSWLSKILVLAVGTHKIPDTSLEAFLRLVEYNVDFSCADDLGVKPVIHECCLVFPTECTANVSVNNGVKIVNHDCNHSRLFLVQHVAASPELHGLLTQIDFNGRTCLHYAAQNNRLDLLELVLPLVPKRLLDVLDKELMLPLLLAIKYGHFEAMQMLLKFGSTCFPDIETQLQYLPLNYACKKSDFQTLDFLLSFSKPGPEMMNRPDAEGLCPLHTAARAGNGSLIKLLIEYGASVNKLDGLNKWPPLFYAVQEGHADTTRELIKAGACLDIIDEDGYNVLYYCVIEGHIDVLNLLLAHNVKLQTETEPTKVAEVELDKEAIPHLELPPPILPLRRYGHSFLEQKVLIELLFPARGITLFSSGTEHKPGRITITSSVSDIIPRNVILTDEQTSCLFQTDTESLREFRIDFEVFPKFGTRLIAKTTALEFRQIDTSSPEVNTLILPLFDMRLRSIGELKLNYQVIFPFSGTLLETKFDTYWKSFTSCANNKVNIPSILLSPQTPAKKLDDLLSSFVTATSLNGEYLKIKTCLLNDGTPVACPHWAIFVAEDIELFLPNMSLKQLTQITSNLFDYEKVMNDLRKMKLKDLSYVKKLLKIVYVPLHELLECLDVSIHLSIELVFPSLHELDNVPFAGNIQLNLNKFIDMTLTAVFEHVRAIKEKTHLSRSLFFLSSNSIVCKILNWKQPNYPVFLIMNGIVFNNFRGVFEARTANGLLMDELLVEELLMESYARRNVASKLLNQLRANDQELTIRSIREATNFATDNNLMGVITSIHLLNLVPKLIPLIRSQGLVLVASNDLFNPGDDEQLSYQELDTYIKTEINGLRFDDVLSFKNDA